MNISIDFKNKEIEVLDKVNVQDLFMRLGDLNLDLSEYTFKTKVVYLPSFSAPIINNLGVYLTPLPYCGKSNLIRNY